MIKATSERLDRSAPSEPPAEQTPETGRQRAARGVRKVGRMVGWTVAGLVALSFADGLDKSQTPPADAGVPTSTPGAPTSTTAAPTPVDVSPRPELRPSDLCASIEWGDVTAPIVINGWTCVPPAKPSTTPAAETSAAVPTPAEPGVGADEMP